MKKLFCLFTMLLMVVSLSAQGVCRYCLYDHMKSWKDADSISMETPLDSTSYYGYVFTSKDKKMSKTLKYDAMYVLYNDTLYINCMKAVYPRRNYYAKAIRAKNNMVFFVADQSKRLGAIVGGVAGGAIGASIGVTISDGGPVVGSKKKLYTPFFWDMQEHQFIRITPQYMKGLMNGNKALLKRYKAESKVRQSSPDVVMDYLREMDVIP